MSLIENLLPDRFEILGELGRGGTSVVFHARDKERDQEVAVKVLLREAEEHRFQREAERLASLNHPNVVGFLEVGQHEGRDFLVMEYLEMGDLTSYVQGLSVIQILQLFSQICDGLAHLHDKGIVHRDIKPANILVGKEGRPKITDLGVARQVDRNTRLTQAGTILGTYSYLAPEQILSSTVGPRADIYSLGICLFSALTGRKPFEAENEFKMLKAHLEEPPPSILEYLPTAPTSLDHLVQKMLAKEEDDRPRSARAVADLLQECVRDLEAQNVEDLQPAWDETIEELPDDERSVLLAISFLGKEATFEKVCLAAPFSEDKTDRCLEALMERKLIDSPTEDRFSLRVPEDTVQTRLTPRLRKLFATRLSSMEASLSNAGSGSVQVLEPALSSETPEVAAPPVDSSAPSPEGGTTEDEPTQIGTPFPSEEVVPPPEETHQEPERANTAPVKVAQSPDTKPKSQESSSAKPRWALISVIMLVIGVVLTVAGQWYYSHSASVHITTNPAGAVVEVNGLERGKSPLTVSELTPGLQVIDVKLDGYRAATEKVELGFMQSQDTHLSLDPIVGKLLLTLKPRDAVVTIDGQEYGVIKSDLTLADGSHSLAVQKQGFETYESTVVVSEGEPLNVEVALSPIVGSIEVTSVPEGASVSLDGEDRGKTPLTLDKVSFGKHDLAVRLQGYDRVTELVDITSKKPVQVKAELKELPGGLAVTSSPAGAKLKVNGEVKGDTPQSLSGLKAGTYTLTLSKDGYRVWEMKKTVKAGEETKVDANLEPIVVSRPPTRPIQPPPIYRPPSQPPVQPRPRPRPRPPVSNPGNPWTVE